MGKTYAEQIAEWRSYRQQQEQAQRLDEIRAEHAQAARERDQAVADGDVETATDRATIACTLNGSGPKSRHRRK